MALSEGNVILASDFIALKARVKAECKRRKYNGSVKAYAGSSYDYTVKPKNGNVPLPEHFNKIIVPMNAMVKTGRSKTKNGDLVRAMNDIDTALTKLERIAETAKNGGCKSSCTGLCQGTCSTGCSGCSGTCTGGCSSGCSGSCKGSCDWTCTKVCYDNCDSECYGECATGCSGGCTGGCSSLCKGSCKSTCTTGCSGSCKGSCKTTCVGNEGPYD